MRTINFLTTAGALCALTAPAVCTPHIPLVGQWSVPWSGPPLTSPRYSTPVLLQLRADGTETVLARKGVERVPIRLKKDLPGMARYSVKRDWLVFTSADGKQTERVRFRLHWDVFGEALTLSSPYAPYRVTFHRARAGKS